MDLVIQIALLVLGFVMLIKGADFFVDGAAGIAVRLGIPQIIIGLTIVAMGTSAPEAAISISSALKGSAGIAVGNVIGSNIMNILLILGITAVITPLAVHINTIKFELPFVIFITGVFAFIGLKDNILTLTDGIILWALFLCYLAYLFIMTKKDNNSSEDSDGRPIARTRRLILYIFVGVGLIIWGSNLAVDAATNIATAFGVSDRIIGLTIVAFGTSLPELVTCIAAGLKHNADIAIGNIVGSNIFNILFVIGTSALITPVAYQAGFLLDSIFCISAAVLLLIFTINKSWTLKRYAGFIMLAVYAAYFVIILM